MNWAHVHLIVNHLPVILVPTSIALLVFARARRSGEVTNAGLVLLVVTALIGGGVFLTGEPAEHAVEGVAGITEASIEAHEDAALAAALATGLAGVLALATLVVSRTRPAPAGLLIATVVVGLAASGLMARAANLGGLIRHSEIAGNPLTSQHPYLLMPRRGPADLEARGEKG